MVARNRRFVGAERPTRRGERLALEPLEPRVLLAAGAAVEVLNASPALFAANLGQWADPAVRYAFQTSGGNVLHTDAGPVFQLFQSEDTAEGGCATQFSVTFEGASTVAPSGQDASQAVYNYYVGDPSSWRTGVPTFQTVAYEDLWSGIDLLTWGRRDGLKYEFHVAPGADPAQIRLRYDGIEGLSLDDSGALRIATALGEVTDDAPIIYQEVGGQRVQVAGAFSLIDATTYGFAITGSYDPQAELVIDPLLGWSTYLGGASADDGYAIALDGSGAVFVTGVTASGDFPTPGGFDTTLGGTQDAFVTKLNPTGTLLWSSFLGGSGLEGGYAIAVDGSGAALVTGMTESPDFPTAGGFDTTLGGTRDAFVAKVSGAGALLWSSYLGGAGADAGYGIARDGSGAAMLTGSTESADFPTAGGFDATLGGTEDAFVTKVSGTGVLLWSSYLGGAAGTDRGYGIAVDNWGAAFLTGATSSTDFPVPGALDTSLGGPEDAFVAQVSGAGGLLWATYLGGSNADSGYGIAVDGSGNAVVTGSTQSPDFPTPVGFDTLLGGGQDAFVTKLTPTAYIWSSYLGGSAGDTGYAIALDAAGNALITGVTGSPDLATPGVFDTTLGGSLDAFVARVGVGGALLFASYLGGSGTDLGSGIAVDGSGNAFVAGMTSSPDFPTPGGIDTTLGGTGDAFVTKIVNSPPTLTAVAPLPGATEDQPFTIPYATLAGAADDADSDGDTLSFRIEAVTTGTLTEGGVPVVPGTTLLSPGESLVWTPAANANGAVGAFTVVAWDGRAASAAAVPVNVNVAAVNDAPTLTTVATLSNGVEDQDLTISYATLAAAADEADVDGDPLSFRIEAVSSGTLTKGGVPVVPGDTLGTGEDLVWRPALNANGTLRAFTVVAWDGQAPSATAVPVNVGVAPVNDPPTLTTVTTLPGGVENQDFTITYATLAGAADEADIEGDPLSFLVDGVSTGTLTKNGVPVVPNVTLLSAGESLVWRPATDANGTLQAFTVRAWDGHSPSATPVQVSVVVAPSNIPPTLTTVAPLLGGVEDQDYTITYAALAAAANEADPNGDPLSFRVQAVSSGTLTKGGAPVVPGTTLLSAGEDLLWRPALDANGTLQAFTVVAWDGRAPSATPVPVNVEVTPVNDAPSFTEGADQVVNEDAGLQTVAGWATSISPGPADEAGQVVGFLVTNDNNPLFTVQPTVAADGTLTFVSAPDAHGLATVTVKLQDDGGTANGGVDTSAEQTFTVTVNSVNDVPSFAKGPDQTVLPGVGLQTVPGWAANPSPGPANEAGQAVDFLVANDNNALFSIQPAIAPDGSLSYAPATDAHGVATVTVRIHDDGGTANGGVDTSAAQTFTITVNTPPEFQPPFPAGATAEVLVGELFAFDFTATDADPGDPLTFSRIAGPAWLTIDPATGVLSGTPARRPNNLGIFSVTVRVTDGLGGTDDHTFDLGVRGQIITLNAALPKTTFNDSNNNRVSVSLRGPGTVYLVRDFPLGAPFTNATPADLAAIETAGTDVLSSLTVTVKPAKGQLPRTTVGTIVIDNSLGTLAAAPLALTGNASVAGSVVRFTLGDVAAQHLITIRTDLAIPFSSVVLGLVQDASLTSDTPLRLLSIVEWLDTDGTPDVIATPWIASLATRGGKVPGLPAKLAGDFQASLNLRGAPAIPLALMKVAIRGSVLGGDWRIGHDIGGAIRVRGNFTNTSIHAWMLNSLTVGGLITEDLADGDTDVIEVVNGIFWASDAAWGGFIPPDHWFDGVRAYVG